MINCQTRFSKKRRSCQVTARRDVAFGVRASGLKLRTRGIDSIPPILVHDLEMDAVSPQGMHGRRGYENTGGSDSVVRFPGIGENVDGPFVVLLAIEFDDYGHEAVSLPIRRKKVKLKLGRAANLVNSNDPCRSASLARRNIIHPCLPAALAGVVAAGAGRPVRGSS